jgi:hypothetical protein
MASTAASLYDLASELLGVSAAILAGTSSGAPTWQVITQGPPPYDCTDMLAVSVGTIAHDPNLGRLQGVIRDNRVMVVPIVPMTVTVLRCASAVPTGGVAIDLPTVAQILADSEKVYQDGWSLFCGLNGLYRSEQLFSGYPCRVFAVDGALPIAPEGGALGWGITLHVQLDGFDPPGVDAEPIINLDGAKLGLPPS